MLCWSWARYSSRVSRYYGILLARHVDVPGVRDSRPQIGRASPPVRSVCLTVMAIATGTACGCDIDDVPEFSPSALVNGS